MNPIDTVHVVSMSDITLSQAAQQAAKEAAEKAAARAHQEAYEAALAAATAEEARKEAERRSRDEHARHAAADAVSDILIKETTVAVVRLMTQSQLAEHLSASPRTLEAWRMQKKGPKWLKLQGKVYYPAALVNQWVLENASDQLGIDLSELSLASVA